MKKELSFPTYTSSLFANRRYPLSGWEVSAFHKRKRYCTKAIIIISLVLSFCNGSAQNAYRDSVRKKLASATDDSSKVLLLSKLGYYWRYTNMDSAIYYASPALEQAKKLKNPRIETTALSNLATILREKGELPMALKLQMDALEIAKENNYVREEGSSLRRIGLVYMDLSESWKTVEYCRKALHNHQLIGNNIEIGQDYLVTAQAYNDLKNPDSAWYFIQKAGEKINSIRDLEPEYHLWRGNAFLLKGIKDSAMAEWREGVRTGLNMEYYRSLSYIFLKMGNMYRQMNEPDSSIFYAKKGLVYAQKASHEKTIFFLSKLLFDLYDSLNRPLEALYYSKIASAAKDSLLGAGNITNIRDLIANENARQTEIQTARASYQSRLRQIMLAMGMAAILIIAIILYRNNRKKQKTNLTLAKQKSEIQDTLIQLKSTQAQLIQSEKMASLGEMTAGVAHEIQNPLNFVNNFSEINAELMQEMEHEFKSGNANEAFALAETIKQNIEKVHTHGKRADAIVKSMLQHTRASSGQKELTDINALADEYLKLSYQGLRARDKSFNAAIKTDFDADIGKINIIPQEISRVLLNLFNNAFYAANEKARQTPNGYQPQVSIKTKRDNGMAEITVKDNGCGIPENIRQKIFQPFFTTKPAGQGTGLGLSLAYDIIKAHGGEIKIQSEVGKGSEFTVYLPLA
jgi:signal transduction histidine kinase